MCHKGSCMVLVGMMLVAALCGMSYAIRIGVGWEYAKDEILWFDVSDEVLVAARGDGTISIYKFPSGEPLSKFTIPGGYRHNEVTLAISRGKQPVLAIVRQEDINTRVVFYDLLTANALVNKEFPHMMGGYACGFSADGKAFLWGSLDSVSCLSVKTGDLLWSSEDDDHMVLIETIPMSDAKGYINLTTNGRVVARSAQGKILWEKNGFEAACWSASAAALYREEPKAVVGIRLEDGKALWSKDGLAADELRAISSDGTKQAFFTDNSLVIASLPAKETVRVREVDKPQDMVFSRDGRLLACLSELVSASKKDENGSPVTLLKRSSHMLHVVEVRTGKILFKIDLK